MFCRSCSRSVAALVAAAGVSALLAACGSSSSSNSVTKSASAKSASATTGGGKSYRVVYAQYASSIPFSAEVSQSLKAAAAKAGISLTTLDNQASGATTLSNAHTAANEHPNLFVEYSPLTVNQEITTTMKHAGVPVLAIQTAVPGAPFFGINNPYVGKVGAQGVIAAAMKKWGNAAPTAALILNYDEGGTLDLPRGQAAEQAIRAAYPHITIVKADDKDDVGVARSAMSSFLTSHPTGHLIVWCNLDDYSVAAAQAVIAAHRTGDVLIGSTGGESIALPFIKQGVLAGTVDLSPQTWGTQIVALIKKIEDKQSPAAVTRPTGTFFVNASDATKYLAGGSK